MCQHVNRLFLCKKKLIIFENDFLIKYFFFVSGGWDNISRPHLFDLHCVRLCFEMFACDNTGKVINRPIAHVLSIPILDKKSSGSLKIVEISTPSASVMGGDKIIILCDKVKLQEISVLFYEEDDDGNIIWKEEINHKNSTSMKVHHQYAISLQSPKYWEFDIIQPRSAFIQLVRSKDNEFSEPIPFEFVPNPQSMYHLNMLSILLILENIFFSNNLFFFSYFYFYEKVFSYSGRKIRN